MELDNQAAKQAYIQLMTEVLEKKIEALNVLLNLTMQQEAVISADSFEEDRFLQIITLKGEQIDRLSKLDSGFEKLFNSVKEEVNRNKEKYEKEITLLKDQISSITGLSVKIQAAEKQNKMKLEMVFANKRRDIKKARISSKTATNYYKTMSGQYEAPSFFYDKKK